MSHVTLALSSLTTTRMVRSTSPPTTILNENLDFQSSQAWRKPFEQLLILLRVVPSLNALAEIGKQYFCFQHTHDLSKLSTVFLSVHTPPGFEQKIHLDNIRFDDPDSESYLGRVFVAELEEYANRVLSRVRVSVFIHTCIKLFTQRSKI